MGFQFSRIYGESDDVFGTSRTKAHCSIGERLGQSAARLSSALLFKIFGFKPPKVFTRLFVHLKKWSHSKSDQKATLNMEQNDGECNKVFKMPEGMVCASLSASDLTQLLSLTQIEGRNVVFTSADTDL